MYTPYKNKAETLFQRKNHNILLGFRRNGDISRCYTMVNPRIMIRMDLTIGIKCGFI